MTSPGRALAIAPRRPQEPARELDAVEMLRAAAEATRGATALGWTVLRVATDSWPARGNSFPPSDG